MYRGDPYRLTRRYILMLKTTLLTLCGCILCLCPSLGWSACLLSFEEANTLNQGNVRTVGSFLGGQQGLGVGGLARLGLLKKSELHLRLGACQRKPESLSTSKKMWGFALEMGLKKELLSHTYTQLFTLSVSMSATLFQSESSSERIPSYSSIGLQPLLLMSFPFQVKDLSSYASLILGSTLYFVDQNLSQSQFEGLPLIGLNTGFLFTEQWGTMLEIRYQESGVYGGIGASFAF